MFERSKWLASLLTLLAMLLGASSAAALDCDVDNDGDIDRIDIGMIFAARNTQATGPDDPRDPTGDGIINVIDGRSCMFSCTLPSCASPAANTPPTADAGPDQNDTLVGDTVVLDGSGSSDVDADPLTFAWAFVSTPPGSSATLFDPTAVMPTFVVDLPGAYEVQLIVNDGTVDSSPDTVIITTTNSPPLADAGPDQTAFVGNTVPLDGSGSSDVDGDPLSFAWSFVSVPAGSAATLSDPTAVMPTFNIDLPGSYVVQLVVNDGAIDSTPDTVVIATDNSAPVADAGPDQTTFVGNTVPLDGSGSSDVDGDPLSFAWSFVSVPAGSIATLSDPTAVLPTFNIDRPGSYVVQLIVNDSTVDSAPDTMTVTTENTPPVADAGPDQTVLVGDTVALDGSGSSDVDNDALNFSWSLTAVPAGSAATLSDPGAEFLSFEADAPGTYVAQLIVNDGQVDSAPDTVTITTGNSPPVAEAGPDQTVLVGDTVALDGSGSSDVDNDALNFSWSLTAVPAGSAATLNDPTLVAPSFVADIAGTYVAQLIVNDGQVDSAPDTVTITTGNSPPVADAGPDQTVLVGDTVALDGSGSSDVDNDALNFSWSLTAVPAGSAATLNDPTLVAPSFLADIAGTYVAQLIVNDGQIDSAPDTVTITTGNSPPVADAGPDQTVQVGDPVQLDGSGSSDVDNDALNFSWSLTAVPAGSAATLNDPTLVAPSFNADMAGIYEVQLIVNDGNLDSPPDTLVITAVALPTLSIDDVSLFEAETGTTNFVFTISLSQLSAQNVDVTVNVTDNTTTAGSDYPVFPATPVTINAGDLSTTLTVPVNGDETVELNETFFVDLSSPANALIADGQGLGTIINDDLATLSIDDLSLAEGDSGATNFTFTVTLDAAVDVPVDLLFASADGTATIADNDYTAASGPLSFTGNAGETQTITVPVVGDAGVELDETFFIDLSDLNAAGRDVTFADSQGQGTVLNDDNATLSIGDLSLAEGDSGATTFTFTVTLDAAVDVPVDLLFASADGTATIADNDYTAASGPLSFAGNAGETQTITVPVVGDAGVELDETFFIDLSDLNAAGRDVTFADSQGQGTVLNDDNATLSIDDLSLAEGDSGATNFTFTVTLDAAVDVPVDLLFASADGTATIADNDYTAASGPLSFAGNAGETQTITVPVVGDTDVELDQTFFVNLSGLNAAGRDVTFADSQGQGTILNDDVIANTITLSPATLNLQTFATSTLTVTLSSPAQAGGQSVTLASDAPGIASVPASVVVPEGNTSTVATVTAGSSTGAALISASAAGFTGSSSTVNVSPRTMTVGLEGPLVGVARTISGTVTLPLPAPAGGVTVSLSTVDTGVATVSPVSVNIPAGTTQASFNVTGVAAGTTDVTANATGYAPATATITTTLSQISMATGVSVAPDQTVGVAVSLSTPAPTGGVTISFTSSDPSIATITPSVFVPAGQQIAAANPQLTGIAIGMVQLQATAVGFAPDTKNAVVTINLSFNPTPFNIVESTTADITLNLSAPAPTGGLTLNLNTDDAAIATVPTTITIPVGQTSVQVPVTGLVVGSTTLRAAATGISEGTAEINVTAAPPINIGNSTIGDDLQVGLGGTLGVAAPAGNLEVTITSDDPSRLLLSNTATDPGSASITLQVNAGSTGIPGFYLQALDDAGSVDFTASAPGYATDTSTVTFAPSGFAILSPGSITTTTFASNTSVLVYAIRLDPTTLNYSTTQPLRAGLSVDVDVISSDTTVGTITSSPLTFTGGDASLITEFDPQTTGSTDITVGVPTGFDPPNNYTGITATVSAPNINLQDSNVGEDLQQARSISLGATPPSPVDVTITVDDPSVAVLSTSNTSLGSGSLLVTGVANTNVGTFYVQGLAQGATTITVTAPGFNPKVANVTVNPSGFAILSPGSISTTTFSGNTSVLVYAIRLDPTTLNYSTTQPLRAGLSVDVDVISSDTGVGTITSSPLTFTGGVAYLTTAFDPQGAGSTDITVGVPTGFDPPNNYTGITATVSAPNINLQDSNVGEDLQQARSISLGATPPSPVDVTITVDDPSVAVLSTSNTSLGSGSLLVTGVANTNVGTFYVQGLAQGATTITVTAPGFNPKVANVTVNPSGFAILSPGSISTTTFSGNTSVLVYAIRLDPTTLNYSTNQQLRPGLSVDVDVISSDTTVGTITSSPLTFTGGDASLITAFDPQTTGSTDITVGVPTGFDPPNNYTGITATVSAPNINLQDSNVGEDLQQARSISLGATPPGPVDVTVTVSSGTIATISTDGTQAGGTSLTFTGVTTTSVGTIYVQGRSLGTTTITVQAAGYNDRIANVTVDPSGFAILSPGSITTTAAAANTSVLVYAIRLDPTTLNYSTNQPLRGGLTADVEVTSSDTGVGTITSSPLTFTGGDAYLITEFDPQSAGSTFITASVPSGFDPPSNYTGITATVNP